MNDTSQAVQTALTLFQRGDFVGAQRACSAALVRQPNNFEAHLILGAAYFAAGKHRKAIASLDSAISLNPRNHDAFLNRGLARLALGETEVALADFTAALVVSPQFVPALNHRAKALFTLGRLDEAMLDYETAARIAPDYIETHFGRGELELAKREGANALISFNRAVKLNTQDYRGHLGRAEAFYLMGNHHDAIEAAAVASALGPKMALPQIIVGKCFLALGGLQEAKAALCVALAREPRNPDALYCRGEVLFLQRKYQEACEDLRRAHALSTVGHLASGQLLLASRMICDWRDDNSLLIEVQKNAQTGLGTTSPFALVGRCDDPRLIRMGTESWVAAQNYKQAAKPPRARRAPERLRIGYVAGEFRAHPTAFLICETLQRHDRQRFEVLGFSIGPTDDSDIGARVRGAVDRLIDCHGMDAGATSMALAAQSCDILIDLSGHIAGARLAAFATRPSPIQVNFLGFPGTSGAPFMDYIIADKQTIPDADLKHYTESVCRMPYCYQCTSPTTTFGETPTRASLGLPDDCFVFCSFNNNWKITPDVFNLWMHLLRERPKSVLWLFAHNKTVQDNLCREAAARDVSPNRLVFAPAAPHPIHMARQKHADLFLDTLPCNAHTTATEALMAGVPLVTHRGKTFAGRVAGSILSCVGLPELIANSNEDYLEIALALSGDPERYARLRADLAARWPTAPLFDNVAYTRALEEAYWAMHVRAEQGMPPHSFDVQIPSTGVAQ